MFVPPNSFFLYLDTFFEIKAVKPLDLLLMRVTMRLSKLKIWEIAITEFFRIPSVSFINILRYKQHVVIEIF